MVFQEMLSFNGGLIVAILLIFLLVLRLFLADNERFIDKGHWVIDALIFPLLMIFIIDFAGKILS